MSVLFSGGFDTLKKPRPTPVPTPDTFTLDVDASASPTNSLKLDTPKFKKEDTCKDKKLAVDLLLDTSGSMCRGGDCRKIDALKTAVKIFGTKLAAGDIVAVQRFSSAAAPNGLATETIVDFGTYDQSSFEAHIASLLPGGSTNMTAGFIRAKGVIDTAKPDNADKNFVLIFFSDGVPNEGGDPKPTATSIKGEGVRIITIALGSGSSDYDPGLMRLLASADTDFYPSETEVDLENVYSSIAKSLCRT